MFDDQAQVVTYTASDAREHIAELQLERATAADHGLFDIEAYRRDIEAEIERWKEFLIIASVTEIATLQAELDGARFG